MVSMLRRYMLTFLFAFLCIKVIAQNKFTDSLMQRLRLSNQDSTRVLIMADLCYFYRYTNLDSSLFYGQNALELANKINFLRGQADALNKLGLTMREEGDLPKSLELQFHALKIAKDNDYVIELAQCYRRIGHVYMDLKDYPHAVWYSFQALKMDMTNSDERSHAIESMDLGDIYQHMNQSDSALYYIRHAFEKIDLIEDLSPDVYRVLGNIQAGKNNKDNALEYYQKGIQVGLNIKDFRTISFIYANMAIMFKKMNQPDSSIYFAKNALKYGQITSYKKGILLSANLLSDLYDSINPKEALRYYKISAEAKDSLFGAGNIQTIQSLIARENERQQEVDIARAEFKNQLKQYGLLAGIAVFLIIALILYKNNNQKEKANQKLGTALANLKATQSQLIQSEKMASLGELTAGIAHEIQNPLNFVNNFSEVNVELIEELQEKRNQDARDQLSENELLNDIKENALKINHHGKRADAIVKGMLLHAQSSTGKKEPTDINALAEEYLHLSYNGIRAKDQSFNTQLKTNFDASIGIMNLVPQDIGRVLLNLYNNAFYAVGAKNKLIKETYEPIVSVSTKRAGNKVSLSVHDNGNGIPKNIVDKIFQPFFTTKPTGQGTGLGLSLSYDLIKALGGEIKVETVEGDFTEFIIFLPA